MFLETSDGIIAMKLVMEQLRSGRIRHGKSCSEGRSVAKSSLGLVISLTLEAGDIEGLSWSMPGRVSAWRGRWSG